MSSPSFFSPQTQVAADRLPSISFPSRLPSIYTRAPKLTPQQCGHLRHFHNLASQIDGEWSLMGSQEPGQEWDTAYRYQLATMAYATGAAYYHRLPAMRSMLKPLMRKLIGKMLRREVWGYWYLTSQSGIRANPDLKELRKPWADPVCKENVMYSGHLLLMVSLYSMLFNDHEFDDPESIVFDWNPLFYGMGSERFCYSRSSLQTAVLKEMERENWMGACCEPNMVFIICNQFPIIATRYNDVRNGTDLVSDVLQKYRAAWSSKGMISPETGLFRAWYNPGRDVIVDSEEIGHSAWVMAFMPWNYHLIQSMYPSAGTGFLHRTPDGRINIHPPSTANAIKRILAQGEGQGGNQGSYDPNSPALIARARDESKAQPASKKPYLSPTFGHVAQWLSEVAGPAELDKLLRHAKRFMRPTWRDGGFYYARCDQGWDREGNYTYVEPYTGNAAVGYASLNVKDGQRRMWERPWTAEDVERQVWLDGVGLEEGVDCSSGIWDEEMKVLRVTLRSWQGENVRVRPVVRNLKPGQYGLYVDGTLREVKNVRSKLDQVAVDLEVGGQDVDLVLLQADVGFHRTSNL